VMRQFSFEDARDQALRLKSTLGELVSQAARHNRAKWRITIASADNQGSAVAVVCINCRLDGWPLQ